MSAEHKRNELSYITIHLHTECDMGAIQDMLNYDLGAAIKVSSGKYLEWYEQSIRASNINVDNLKSNHQFFFEKADDTYHKCDVVIQVADKLTDYNPRAQNNYLGR